MDNLCPEAVHPRGPAEWACYHYYNLNHYYYPSLFLILSINKLYPEAARPCGPAEGIHSRYLLASRGTFKHAQGC